MAKRDFASAFKLLWVELGGLWIMAVSIVAEDLEDSITVLYLTMVFGWTGAPGEWAVWGRGVQDLHQAHAPPQPEFHDLVAYASEVLVDDGVLVEPLLGVRPWLSAWAFDTWSRKLLGNAAINAAKMAAEGDFTFEKLIWGLLYQLQDEQGRPVDRVTLPEIKIQKMSYLLQEPELAPGCRRVRLRTIQQIRGLGTHFAVTNPSLGTELGSVDVMMARPEGAGQWAMPRGTAAEQEVAWQEFWDTCDVIRVMTARPESWGRTFVNSFTGMLEPRERLGVPGAAERVIWIGGDATPTVAGQIDWDAKLYARQDVVPYLEALKEAAGAEEEWIIIALTELFCIVAMTAERGADWVDRLVLYVGDNQNVQRWVETRHARNRLARHLIRLLNYTEAKYRFQILAAPYIRTYSNEMADMITRATKEEVADRMTKEGFQEVDLGKTWKEVLAQSYERRVHAVALVDPEDWQIAMQLMSRRRKAEVPETLDLTGWCLVEFGATLPVYAQAAGRLGVPVVCRPAVGWEVAKGSKTSPPPGSRDLAAATLGPSAKGTQIQTLLALMTGEGAEWLLLDVPAGDLVTQVLRELRRQGWAAQEESLLCSEVGDPVAQRKVWVLASRRTPGPPSGWLLPPDRLVAPPLPLAAGLLKYNRVDKGEWVTGDLGRLVLDPRAAGRRNRDKEVRIHALPKIVGHWKPQVGPREPVYSTAGPTPTLRQDEGGGLVRILVQDVKGPAPGVRPLQPVEAWMLRGGTFAEWQDQVARTSEEAALRGVLRAPPVRAASEAIMAAFLQAEPTKESRGE